MRSPVFSRHAHKLVLYLSAVAAMLAGFPIMASPPSPDLALYALCDVRVVYLFNEPETIDWPVLYYLNDEFGVRVDLITFGRGLSFGKQMREIPDREIYLHTYSATNEDSTVLDSVLADMFAVRRPDIVILGEVGIDTMLRSLGRRLIDLVPDKKSLFNVVKVYRQHGSDSATVPPLALVTLNRRELLDRYRQRMELEVPQLFTWYQPRETVEGQLARYDLVRRSLPPSRQDPDFLSGLAMIRMTGVIDSVLDGGAVRVAFKKRASSYLSLFGGFSEFDRQTRVRKRMSGLRELTILEHQAASESKFNNVPEFLPYLQRLLSRAQRTVLNEIGMSWDGKIILRDSPHGPKLKFRAALSVNGPQEINLSTISFQPFWDTIPVVLDSVSRVITPHQSFVHEYLVEIDGERLESRMPESLLFMSEIAYGSFPMTVKTVLPIWESPDLNVRFQPAFHIIQPFARLEVDRVVSSMNWKATITKPKHYSGTVKIELAVPRGVFAGAYRQEVTLEKGRTSEMVRIPFSVSNLFEMGIQYQTLTLSVEGRPVAADTGIMRLADCHVADTIKIGFLPDTTGLLEDILRMTDADFRPLTDRSLLAGDLEAYDVILVGSGAVRAYPSFREIKGRLEQYVQYGGSLVIFGQAGDWPQEILPISLVPVHESVLQTELFNRIDGARMLSRPHSINEQDLLAWFSRRRTVSAAVVSPAEQVYVTPTGATLLSITRLGKGQIVYCGLPIIEMISELNLEAIHLLANILNY